MASLVPSSTESLTHAHDTAAQLKATALEAASMQEIADGSYEHNDFFTLSPEQQSQVLHMRKTVCFETKPRFNTRDGNCYRCEKMTKYRCGKCRHIYVCSKDCMKALHPTHKLTCRFIKNTFNTKVMKVAAFLRRQNHRPSNPQALGTFPAWALPFITIRAGCIFQCLKIPIKGKEKNYQFKELGQSEFLELSARLISNKTQTFDDCFPDFSARAIFYMRRLDLGTIIISCVDGASGLGFLLEKNM